MPIGWHNGVYYPRDWLEKASALSPRDYTEYLIYHTKLAEQQENNNASNVFIKTIAAKEPRRFSITHIDRDTRTTKHERGYVVKYKRIRESAIRKKPPVLYANIECVAVIRLSEDRRIVFAFLPRDIWSVFGIHDAAILEDIYVKGMDFEEVNLALNQLYGISITDNDCFEDCDFFEYRALPKLAADNND